MTDPQISRRTFLAASGATGVGLALPGLAVSARPARAARPAAPDPLAILGRSLREERDYAPRIEGNLPADLSGTLYRNGPGLFERDGLRKKTILDGDGMIQAFDFGAGGVRYRNRFVRTTKWLEEEAAGRFLHPTWTTLGAEWLRNVPGIPERSQAGVVPTVKAGRLLALDEVGDPWALDPRSLATEGEFALGPRAGMASWKAHTKTDGVTGEWIAVGDTNDEHHVIVRDRAGHITEHHRVPTGDRTYVHDFFATPRFVVLNLHAAAFGPRGLLLMSGFASVRDALVWRPERGNRVLVIDRRGELAPRSLEAPAAWMWHSVNAFDRGDEIVADFIGYDAPDHFLGEDAALATIMEGRRGIANAPGTLRRYTIDPVRGTLGEETLDAANHEYPCIDPRESCHAYETFWACTAERGIFHDGLVRIDLAAGTRDVHHFGAGFQVGEPVLVPGRDGEPAWILALVLDAKAARSHLAILRAEKLSDGPVARVHLDHHAPYSFHGTWAPRG